MVTDLLSKVHSLLTDLPIKKELILPKLFYELGYEYIRKDATVITREWTPKQKEPISHIEILAASGDFKVFWIRINSEKLLRGQERNIINKLNSEYPYNLVIFSNNDDTEWDFINVKLVSQQDNENMDPVKRKFVRRIKVEETERLRTAADRISKIIITKEKISPLELQKIHDDAFDVEKVTKEFFKRFGEAFQVLKEAVADNNSGISERICSEQSQTILNRILFLYFIQKKGWLNQNKSYLYDHFQEYYKGDHQGFSYYTQFLQFVFLRLSNKEYNDTALLRHLPFLNGGLFNLSFGGDPTSNLTASLKIPNTVFNWLFTELFEHYNFTVQEHTPFDIQVAIDPEMLGKIFESLILQLEKDPDVDLRKATGSYYTPRTIVHFMCQQALKEYLATESGIKGEKIEKLMQLHEVDQLTDEDLDVMIETITPEETKIIQGFILQAKIIDPAVGSGAYTVGMLHEMVSLYKKMEFMGATPQKIDTPNYSYDLKRKIIKSCLYGVDIQDKAVKICELRLWLSLIVDYELPQAEYFKTEILKIPQLPNLTYNIRQGDSLIEHLFGHPIVLDELTKDKKGRDLVQNIGKLKHTYFNETDVDKKCRLELDILFEQTRLAKLLVEQKIKSLSSIKGGQEAIFKLTPKEKKEREKRDALIEEYKRIEFKANRTESLIKSMQKRKNISSKHLEKLRENLGLTFIWKLDFADIFLPELGEIATLGSGEFPFVNVALRQQEMVISGEVKKGGFDICIGNPPYGLKIDKKQRKYVEENFYFYDKIKNSASIFIELGRNKLKDNGILQYIIPKSLTFSEGWRPTRRLITEKSHFLHIVDVSQAFEDVLLEMVVLSFKKSSSVSVSFFTGEGWFEKIEIFGNVETSLVKRFDIIPIYYKPDYLSIIEKLSGCVPLDDISTTFRGLPYQNRLSFDGIPILRGKNIQMYGIIPATDFINLDNNELESPRIKRMLCEKIVSQRIVAHVTKPRDRIIIMASKDSGSINLDTVINTIIESEDFLIDYVLALINSTFASWYYYWFVYNRAIRTMDFDSYYIGKLPIPNISKDQQKPIAIMAKEMSQLVKYNPSSSYTGIAFELYQRIDDAIFRLYNFSEYEVDKIVKGVWG